MCLGSWCNIVVYYDLGNNLFGLFLLKDLMYFLVIYVDESELLEIVFICKFDCICQKLDLLFVDYVLEIGIGWGGFVIYVVWYYGCCVIIIIILCEQFDLVIQCVVEVGLGDCIEILFNDYCDFIGCYDKLVLIEMIEVIGVEFMLIYFGVIL